MDFSSYGFDEETKKKLQSDYDESVSGLKAKRDEKISQAKSYKEQIDALESNALKAAEDVEDAKVKAAEAEGNIEKYKLAVEERDVTIGAMKREFQEREDGRIKQDAVHEFSKIVSDNDAAQFYMKSKFSDSIEVVDGLVKPKDSSLTMETLKESFATGEEFKPYIKASVGSGAGAVGSQGAGSAPAGKADFNGSQSEKLSAAVVSNPALSKLPLR